MMQHCIGIAIQRGDRVAAAAAPTTAVSSIGRIGKHTLELKDAGTKWSLKQLEPHAQSELKNN